MTDAVPEIFSVFIEVIFGAEYSAFMSEKLHKPRTFFEIISTFSVGWAFRLSWA